jgi:hypothetical protein
MPQHSAGASLEQSGDHQFTIDRAESCERLMVKAGDHG